MTPGASPLTSTFLDEVKNFIADLKIEFPDLYPVVPKRTAMVVPSLDPGAFLKPSLPEGDLVQFFRDRCEAWAAVLGVTFNRVSVKDQRSLWGSCTPDGNLNFSWRLALAPDAVLDYLIIHELAHRKEMNHSRRFWAVVSLACPDHKKHRRWLRIYGRALHAVPRP